MSIQRLLPSRVDPTPPDDPDVFALDEDDASDALDALSAGTARQILSQLYERPHSPTELREAVGTSLQNVHYHLDSLESAGLIRQVGTRHSEKGNEMAVYGPASEAVVFVAGESESRIKRAFSRILGAAALLAGGSLAFGAAVERWLAPEPESPEPSGPGIMSESPRTTTEVINAIDPTLAFFLGGLFTLVLVVGWWILRSR
ncbi:ArsR/SmtB family transcription factor [Halapricum desulfuricans]|uniref:Transcriptional regulator containing HTH domain,ArsR family n=1 Tax=Halapricum desulfuricans TaxID=2841257 RepID=A0A897NQF2_9EURY|nr:winged helix-turn-helix domain-containing protein [Halapricum desulfuricans]QSG15012.1 Transcriptional regulator containing HTH domain,ArsR family [Halapricum desulfuricans]